MVENISFAEANKFVIKSERNFAFSDSAHRHILSDFSVF